MALWQSQIFSLVDLPLLIVLSFLELLLSVDNAVVHSVLVKGLDSAQRKRALFVGLIAAFVFRALGILFASTLAKYGWIQVIGGLYLLYVAAAHFFPKSPKAHKEATSFWKCVILIELTDILFAIDSILAAVALVEASYPVIYSKLWLIYFAGLFGLVAIRLATITVVKALDRFPDLEAGAHLMIGAIALKLILSPITIPYIDLIFWGAFALALIYGLFRAPIVTFVKKRRFK